MSLLTETILNVDDYDPGRYARTKTLRQAGFPVIEAASGRQSLDLVLEHRPPLVLLDVNLPDMSGFEVCARIKKDPRTAGTTVLHISASNVESQHLVRGYDAGADSYLVEPVDPPVLIATIRAFLRARKAEEALRRSNEELERFAYMVAHDLNEPLRTVTAHTQLLARQLSGQLDESARERFGFVVEGAKRMRFLIDDILRYSHAANVSFDLQKLDFEVVLSEVIANLDAAIRDSGAQVTHDSLPTIPAHAKIEQVLQNLLSNAIKYRREGVPPCVHISAVADRGTWMFSIRDNGIGIDEQHRSDIFKVFRRHNSQDVAGHGIGLAVCQKIVEAHGGKIWVESSPGAGSVFYFTIPQRN